MEEIRTVILVLGAGVLMWRMVRVLKNLRAEGFLGWKRWTQAREARKRKKGWTKGHVVVWCPEEKTFRCLTCEEEATKRTTKNFIEGTYGQI